MLNIECSIKRHDHSFTKYNKKKHFKTDHDLIEQNHRDYLNSFSSSNCSSPRSLTPANSPPPPPPAPSSHSAHANKRKKQPTNVDKQTDLTKIYNSDGDGLGPQLSQCTDYYDYSTMTKARVESCTSDDKCLNKIECFLETDDLWKKFHELGTEMIITKSGRRMFPSLRVSFSGANLTDKYLIAMDIVPTDSKRYRYAYHRSSWLVAGKADPPVQSRLFMHPDGPFTGETLFKQIISFEKVKLTNNEMDKCGHVSEELILKI